MRRSAATDHLALAGKRRVIPRWKKIVNRFFRFILWAVLALFLYYGESYFSITTVRVEGDSTIPDAEIVRTSGISEVRNIFLVREKKIVAALKKEYPQLETIQIIRSLPGMVVISVSERIPVAAVLTTDGYWLMDHNAVCYRISEEAILGYPLITGLDDAIIVPGSVLNCSGRVKLLTSFFAHWQVSEYLGLEQIDLGNSHNMILHCTPQVEIWLGDSKAMENKLMLIEKSIPYLDMTSQIKLDVRSGRRLVVAGSMAINEEGVDP